MSFEVGSCCGLFEPPHIQSAMSWAAVAKTSPAQPAPIEVKPERVDERIVVVDTNAIISGLHLEGLCADRYCTIAEVLAEVRDKHARQFLTMLPYQLDVREPADESLKAGKLPAVGPLCVRRLQPLSVYCSGRVCRSMP